MEEGAGDTGKEDQGQEDGAGRQGGTDQRADHLLAAPDAGFGKAESHEALLTNIFDDDDGVVDHQPDPENKTGQGDDVDAEVQKIEAQEGDDQG